MTGFLIGFFTIALVILCLFIVLIVLMQRASSGGMGGTMGGGAVDSALGTDSGNVLTKWTIYSTIAFFVIAFGLYLTHMGRMGADTTTSGVLPTITTKEQVQEEQYVPGSLTEAPAEDAAQ